MKWKKSLMVVLVFVAAVVVNVGEVFADGASTEYPSQSQIELHYEGNSKDASHNYYRITVKYGSSGGTRLIPKNLVIYETNLYPDIANGETAGEIEVHRAAFGADAGKQLKDVGDKPYLEGYDKFYYRNFVVKHNPKSEYVYKVVVTWEKPDGVELVRTAETTVKVTKEISTQTVMMGTPNNFSREKWVDTYDEVNAKGETYLPKKYIDVLGRERGYGVVVDGGSLPTYEAVDGHGSVWSIEDPDNEKMDKLWVGDGTLKPGDSYLEGTSEKADMGIFIANAMLQTHVIYTGTPMPDKTVRVYIRNQALNGNSLKLGDFREIPHLSKSLTKLIQHSQIASGIPGGVYPKDLVEVYMGMGTGPQGDIDKANADGENDVSFIFGTKDGTIHTGIELHVIDGDFNIETLRNDAGELKGEELKNHKIDGFTFDFIKLTYNPMIFTGGTKIPQDGFVKPEGFLMLNTKFSIDEEIAVGAKAIVSLQNILDSDLNEYTYFLNKDGTPFDGSSIDLFFDGVPITKCQNSAPCNHANGHYNCSDNTYTYNPSSKEITIKNIGEITPTSEYNIKMVIPTKRKLDGKNVADYNKHIVGIPGSIEFPGKVYPLKMQIIENHPWLENSNDELVRYNVSYTINPYRMPGIN